MRLEYQILIALGLDLLCGDPRWLPHPVRLIGWWAARCETFWRALLPAKTAGLATVLTTLAATGLATLGLLWGAVLVHPVLATIVSILLLYTGFALRDLISHSNHVHQALTAADLNAARQAAALMVSRDTTSLNQEGVARAAVESVAENLVDGITAPLFFAFLGGPLGVMLYKAASTMDSMFGYKNKTYLEFGWAAARLDDLLNFLPARLTGFCIPISALLLGLDWRNSWRIFRRDRRKHASPNSGHPEAAVAGALNVQLGGPSVYFGTALDKPSIGEPSQPLAAAHIKAANHLVLLTSLLCLTGLGLAMVLLSVP